MENIVTIGPPGSGLNFLKNIFLLSTKLRLDLPTSDSMPTQDRYKFFNNYYHDLKNKIQYQNNKCWLIHEWTLRLSHHWTDEINDQYKLVKVNIDSPTVFALHEESDIKVNDPLTVVYINNDNTNLIERLYQLKGDSNFKLPKNISSSNHYNCVNRKYLSIFFSHMYNFPNKVFELTQQLDLDIPFDHVYQIHSLWKQANEILLGKNENA